MLTDSSNPFSSLHKFINHQKNVTTLVCAVCEISP